MNEFREDKPSGTKASHNPFEAVVFVDWNGRQHDLEMTAETLAALTKGLAEYRDGLLTGMLFMDSTLQGSWEGPVAVLPLARGVVRIDSPRRTIQYKADAAVSAECDRRKREKVAMIWRPASGAIVVEGISLRPPEQANPGFDVKPVAVRITKAASHIEPANAEQGEPADAMDGLLTVLMGEDRPAGRRGKLPESTERTVIKEAIMVSMTPAPDGKKLAIRYLLAEGTQSATERILVIDDRGELIADFAIEKPSVQPAAGKAPEPAHAAAGVESTPFISTRNRNARVEEGARHGPGGGFRVTRRSRGRKALLLGVLRGAVRL